MIVWATFGKKMATFGYLSGHPGRHKIRNFMYELMQSLNLKKISVFGFHL